MLSEHRFQTHGLGSHQNYVLQNTYTLMPMNDFDLLSDKNLPNQWKGIEEAYESDITIAHWLVRYVINLHSIGHVPDSAPGALKFISDKSYFVTTLYQALAELVSVGFDAAEFREGEISADENAIFFMVVLDFAISVQKIVSLTLGRSHRMLCKIGKAFGFRYTLLVVDAVKVVGCLLLVIEVCESLLFVCIIAFPKVGDVRHIAILLFLVESIDAL